MHHVLNACKFLLAALWAALLACVLLMKRSVAEKGALVGAE